MRRNAIGYYYDETLDRYVVYARYHGEDVPVHTHGTKRAALDETRLSEDVPFAVLLEMGTDMQESR